MYHLQEVLDEIIEQLEDSQFRKSGISNYIDERAWLQSRVIEVEANNGGFGSILAPYDGEEIEVYDEVEKKTYLAYRVE